MPIRDHAVRIAVADTAIDGTLVADFAARPGVLFVHGWGGSQEQYRARAREVAALGCVCLVFDLRGHARSAPLKAQVSREQNLADVVAAYDHLAANVDVDAGRIAVGGSSYGGYLAAILTSLRPVRWLALRAPALYQDEGWLTPKLQLHTQSLAEYRRRPVTPKENRALAACAEYEGDVLVVESEHDEIIPPASVASYRAACQQAHSLTYRVMRGADHGLTAPAAQREYTQLFCGWISELAFAERAEKKTPEHVAPEPETAPPEIRP